MFSGLSLEEAVELYAASDSRDKHLGVTKDGIASVDLLITHDGREWYPEDHRQSDSFKADLTIMEALEQTHQTLDATGRRFTCPNCCKGVFLQECVPSCKFATI